MPYGHGGKDMGACYSHIDLKERIKLFDLARSGILSVTELARMLGRHRSTVYREISRNFHHDVYADYRGWFPATADTRARRRRRKTVKLIRHKALRDYVLAKLRLGWSPEQIAGRLKLEQPTFPMIGFEAIYQFIYSRLGQSLELYKFLHRHRRRRRKRGGRKPAGSHIPLYCNIKQRPAEIAKRDSFGHWEGDLIIFKREHGKKNLTSLVERKTRFQILLPNRDRKSVDVIAKISERLSPLPPHGRQTMTFDRGTEFMAWRNLHRTAGMKSYFCDVASPWQKGSVENSNGRVRRYLPLEANLDELSGADLLAITDAMNATPRKCLGFQTPKEAFEKHLRQLQ
jgi:transposase, IS30 family